jgi:LacI family transcriptional regulator
LLVGSKEGGSRPAPPTIKDVAAAAGVSIATVSAVLNGTSQVSVKRSKLVRDAVVALGYAPNGPARSLRLGRTSVIGVVVGDIANPFFTSLIRVIEKRASEAGYFVMIANSDDGVRREFELLRLFREQRVAGIILAPSGHDEAYVSALREIIDVPTVVVDRRLPGTPFDTVVVDNRKAARAATQYLLRLGHRRIGIVMGNQKLWTTTERLAGYREALTEAGVASHLALESYSGSNDGPAHNAVQQLLTAADPPTAIFAANNVVMLATIESVLDMGYRCPEDISIAGIDELPWGSAIRPKLTTVCQPIEEIGREALRLLVNRLGETKTTANDPSIIMLEPRLFIQNSCKRIA